MGNLHFDATYNNEDVMRKVRESQRIFVELGNTAEAQGKRIDAAFEKISLKSLERAQEIMKGFPKEVQGISSFQKQLDGLEKQIERVNQRITSVGSGKLTPALSDTPNDINIGDVLKQQVYAGSQAINTLTEKIIQQKSLIKDIEGDIRALGEAYRRAGAGTTKGNALFSDYNSAKKVLQEEKNALFELQTQQAQARLSVRKLRDEQSLYQKETQNVVTANNNMALSFQKTLAAIGGIAMLKQVASNVVSTAGMFQKYESVLTNALNGSSEKAKTYLSDINSFAAKTNFQLNELTDDFIKFVNRGVTPSIDAMRKMGDFTNTVAKPFDQLTEAILDINNPERWKEFGVRVQTEGNKVKLSFRDMTVECDRTVESVMKAVEQFGSMKGVEGSTEAISKTIEGQMSNLEDTITTALAEIGLANQDLISGSISAVDTIVKNYGIIGKSVLALVEIYGVYRAGLLINTIVEQGSVKSIWAKITATKAATIAQAAYNKVLAMNPYVAVGIAVVSLGVAVYTLADHTTYAEKTARSATESMEKMKNASESLKNKINELLSVIRDETSTQYKKADAYLKLQKILPEVFANMDIEKIKLMDKLSLLEKINKASDRREIVGAKTNVVLAQKEVDKVNALIAADSQRGTYSGQYEIQLSDAKSKLEAAKKVVTDIEKIQTEANKQKEKDDKKVVVKNKEHWTNQKKEAEKALESIDSKQRKLLNAGRFDKVDSKVVANYKEQKRLIAEADKELKVYDSTSKQESAADTLRKEQEKRNEELLTLQRNNQKSEIDLMEEGSKKKIAQIELDYKNEIAAIKKQEEKWSKAQGGKLTEKQSQEISIAYTQAEDKKDKGVSDVKKETQKEEEERLRAAQDAWNEYYKSYGTFEEKRLALAKEYQQKIKEVQNDKNKSGDEKNALIATLQKEWDEALANLNLDKLKQDINWEVVFGDMSKVTKKQLQQVKKQLQEFKRSPEFKTSTPEQIKVIEEALNNINTALVDKGGFFGGLTDSLTEYEGTVYKVKEAQEELEKALKSGDEVAIEKAKKKKNAAEQNQANAQANVEKSKDKAISNITAVSNAIVQLGKENVSLSDIGNTVGTLVDALSSSGTKIGGIISAILSIIDAAGEVGTFQYGMDIIENISSTVTDAFARDTESITGLDMSFMKSADYDDYNELVEQYDTLIDVWDQLLDKKKAYIKESYGIEATKAGQEALDLLNSERKITRELASSRLDAGASSGSHSMNYRMWKGSYDYNGTNWKDVAGDISKSLGGVDFSSMWSMLDMSAEQLEWIKTNYSGLWSKMDGDFRGYLDDIIEYGDTENEIIKSINEQLTQTSFDSLFDSFVNTLMDMDASSQDFADNFEEYMRKAIFTSMFTKNYETKLENWYKDFAKANDKEGGITTDDVNDLKTKWDNIVNGALLDREAWEKIVGSSGSESSREASKKGVATASQDSVDELNGRFTVIQGHTYEINSSVKVIQSDTAKIAEKLSFLTSMDKNMSDMVRGHDIIVAHLSNIEGYTANLVDIRQFMYSMKLGIDSLNTKGITLKR